MKYLMIFLIAISFSIHSQAQGDAISTFFSDYMEDDDFTSIYIGNKMFDMISKLDLEDSENQEAIDMLKDIKGLRILTSEKRPMELYKEAMTKFNTSNYEVLMSVKSEGENVRFWVQEKNNVINELLLLVGGEDDFVLLSFLGKIDLNKIQKLSNKIDIKGAEHLKDIRP